MYFHLINLLLVFSLPLSYPTTLLSLPSAITYTLPSHSPLWFWLSPLTLSHLSLSPVTVTLPCLAPLILTSNSHSYLPLLFWLSYLIFPTHSPPSPLTLPHSHISIVHSPLVLLSLLDRSFLHIPSFPFKPAHSVCILNHWPSDQCGQRDNAQITFYITTCMIYIYISAQQIRNVLCYIV